MVAGTQVDFGKELRTTQLVENIINPRKRVAVLDSELIQSSIVYTHSETAIFLGYEKDRGPPRGGAWTDESFSEKFRNLETELVLLFLEESIQTTFLRCGMRHQRNLDIMLPSRWQSRRTVLRENILK